MSDLTALGLSGEARDTAWHFVVEIQRLRAGLAVRDEALEKVSALVQEIHDWDHVGVDTHFPDYARGMNRMLDDVHERTSMAQRILANLQRSLDPYRDDKEQQ